jgi:hypothetical protein
MSAMKSYTEYLSFHTKKHREFLNITRSGLKRFWRRAGSKKG